MFLAVHIMSTVHVMQQVHLSARFNNITSSANQWQESSASVEPAPTAESSETAVVETLISSLCQKESSCSELPPKWMRGLFVLKNGKTFMLTI